MARNIVHNKASMNARLRWRRRIALFLIAIFSCGIYFYFTAFIKEKPSQYIHHLMQHSKTHFNQNLKKVSQVINHDDGTKSIHFEFYKTLPTMQIEANQSKEILTKGPSPTKLSNFLSAENLEKEFSEHLKHIKRKEK